MIPMSRGYAKIPATPLGLSVGHHPFDAMVLDFMPRGELRLAACPPQGPCQRITVDYLRVGGA